MRLTYVMINNHTRILPGRKLIFISWKLSVNSFDWFIVQPSSISMFEGSQNQCQVRTFNRFGSERMTFIKFKDFIFSECPNYSTKISVSSTDRLNLEASFNIIKAEPFVGRLVMQELQLSQCNILKNLNLKRSK